MNYCLTFSSDADNVHLTSVCIIIIKNDDVLKFTYCTFAEFW